MPWTGSRTPRGAPTLGPGAAGNPNAYFNHARDPGFSERSQGKTRTAPKRWAARGPTAPPQSTTTPTPITARPIVAVVPIASFFNRARRLVWPANAPTDGDLGRKRAALDAACLAVLRETEQRGVARLSTVATARDKLIAYETPALAYLRTHSTPRVSDAFRTFLMSLHEALQQAAAPPRASRFGHLPPGQRPADSSRTRSRSKRTRSRGTTVEPALGPPNRGLAGPGGEGR
jgi:hypothetical protein